MKTKRILLIGLLLLTSCNGGGNPSSSSVHTSEFDPDENLASESLLFDDFENGIDIDVWEIAHTKWGNNNNGVVYQNVNYTSDGISFSKYIGDNYAEILKVTIVIVVNVLVLV